LVALEHSHEVVDRVPMDPLPSDRAAVGVVRCKEHRIHLAEWTIHGKGLVLEDVQTGS
jgi:hypothetical protein